MQIDWKQSARENDCVMEIVGVSSGQPVRTQMAKNSGPLSFLDIGEAPIAQFSLLCASALKHEDQNKSAKGIIVWPVEGSGKSDDEATRVSFGERVS